MKPNKYCQFGSRALMAKFTVYSCKSELKIQFFLPLIVHCSRTYNALPWWSISDEQLRLHINETYRFSGQCTRKPYKNILNSPEEKEEKLCQRTIAMSCAVFLHKMQRWGKYYFLIRLFCIWAPRGVAKEQVICLYSLQTSLMNKISWSRTFEAMVQKFAILPATDKIKIMYKAANTILFSYVAWRRC